MQRLLLTLLTLFISSKIFPVRPFITDDARVVGWLLGQYEGWFRFDKHAYQHWNLIAYGPTNRWELTFGLFHGLDASQAELKQYSYAVPLLQAKYLINEYKPNKPPGIAIVAGSFLPGGQGAFKVPGYGAFAYIAITQSIGKDDRFLFHGNIGVNYIKYPTFDYTVMTWGLGTQIRTIGGLHLVAEVISGDPYVIGAGTAYQVGFRHFINDFVQLDLTVGEGIAGQTKLPFWSSAGVRLVTDWFQKKHNKKNSST